MHTYATVCPVQVHARHYPPSPLLPRHLAVICAVSIAVLRIGGEVPAGTESIPGGRTQGVGGPSIGTQDTLLITEPWEG